LTWPASGRQLRISVNVSPLQIQQAGFADHVDAILTAHPSLRQSLVLEITERTLMQDDPAIPEQMHLLHSLGALIAIDDFGVGYSSLGYLQRFPIDILKIDKSFVDNLGGDDGNGGVLANAVLSMAHALRLQAVAEGIEQINQHDDLRALGCDFAQGYLYSRPVPPDQFHALLVNPEPIAPLRPAHLPSSPGGYRTTAAGSAPLPIQRQRDGAGVSPKRMKAGATRTSPSTEQEN
jgi:EAL domain-containing protein (putative c-di-GMP-specific phosphodiesterase class I)